MTVIPAAHRQAAYQVRFDWGGDGAAAVAADADVTVWVDALDALDALDAPDAPDTVDAPGTDTPALPLLPGPGLVLAAGLTDRSAVAARVLDEQVRLGRRCLVAVVAAGGVSASGAPRFAVEDLLAAGAVIDALAALGIDHCSPEAAAACAAFTGLRGAVAHLLTASVSARELVASGSASTGSAPADITPADIAPLARVDSVRRVRVLRAAAEAG